MSEKKRLAKYKDAIQTELQSLLKREVFGPVVQTPLGVIPVGNKWVFIRKRNEKNEIVRYKARFVAQGFSQKSDIDYQDTDSPVRNGWSHFSLCDRYDNHGRFGNTSDGCCNSIPIWLT